MHLLQANIWEQQLVFEGKRDKTDREGKGELSMVWGELDDTMAVLSTLEQNYLSTQQNNSN